MPRPGSLLLVAALLLLAWLLMQGVHELGHVIGAWGTGGTVERVVWHPLTISRTDISRNPYPLVVVWSGPIGGILFPLVAWLIAAAGKLRLSWIGQFFAGFCLLANGLYIGCGSFEGVGDCGEMLQYGSPIWTLWLFGLASVPAGVLLWNGIGVKLGLGLQGEKIEGKQVACCWGALVVLVIVLAIVGR